MNNEKTLCSQVARCAENNGTIGDLLRQIDILPVTGTGECDSSADRLHHRCSVPCGHPRPLPEGVL